jgi:hypothetical protein
MFDNWGDDIIAKLFALVLVSVIVLAGAMGVLAYNKNTYRERMVNECVNKGSDRYLCYALMNK